MVVDVGSNKNFCRKPACLSPPAKLFLIARSPSLHGPGFEDLEKFFRLSQLASRYEQLRGQAKELEANCKLISEAVESLIRIQSKNLDQQLFNKANEIQEEISRKRFDLRCAQIQLAGIRAQVRDLELLPWFTFQLTRVF